MQFDIRLWSFTRGVRGRISYSVIIGIISTSLGVVRLAMLGWIIGLIFQGEAEEELITPIIFAAFIMLLRGFFEHWRTMIAHETSAIVQKKLRKNLIV